MIEMTVDVKIFVINLERSVERRNEIMKMMKRNSIPFEFFDAIDGNKLSEEFIEKCRVRSNKWYQADEGAGQTMKMGEIGAALSHYLLYKKMIDETLEFAIILEDDILFDNRFVKFVKSYQKIKTMMHRFDVLLLGYCGNDTDYYRPAACSFWRRINIDKIFRAGIPVEWCWAAIGYVISLRGSQLLAKKQGEYPCLTADILTANSPLYGARLGVLRNQIIWPGELNKISTIQNRNLNTSTSAPATIEKEAYSSGLQQSFMVFKLNRFVIQKFKSFLRRQLLKLSFKFYPFVQNKY